MRSDFSTGWQCFEGHSYTTPNPMQDQPTILLALDIHGHVKTFVPRHDRSQAAHRQRTPLLAAATAEVEQVF